ncbi:hypothetical protein DLAC_02538 [Tieghemostelium lacteum]|uniref:Uncharacterized protein n=1 Tax=Tieghemostelium lacteum TaxID=361077 RepID=A0A152A343_TIELA|nr:hypothetical protein DLAC_02538 [Tieghemostelium lacteum]|eukprot:KYR00527.1 hypothetical protein DLAC_02538 [Tieghemostelium lacteum]
MNFGSNQFIRGLFRSKSLFTGLRFYSKHSISNEQLIQELPKPKPKSFFTFGKLIAMGVVSKVAYDLTNSAMAYYKGSKGVENILQETWNEAIYPIFEYVKTNESIKRELGNNITLGTPPVNSVSPITQSRRSYNIRALYIPVQPKKADNWFLEKLPQLTTNDKLGSGDVQPQHANTPVNKNKSTGSVISQLRQANELPLLVPYNDKAFFAVLYGEVVSNLSIPIKGSKGDGAILVTLYANDDVWKIRSVDVLFQNTNKLKSIIEPNIHPSHNESNKN